MNSSVQSERVFSGKRTKRKKNGRNVSTLANNATVQSNATSYISWKWRGKKQSSEKTSRGKDWHPAGERGKLQLFIQAEHMRNFANWKWQRRSLSARQECFIPCCSGCEAHRRVYSPDAVREHISSTESAVSSFRNSFSLLATASSSVEQCAFKYAHNVSSATAFNMRSYLQSFSCSSPQSSQEVFLPNLPGLFLNPAHLVTLNGMHNASIFGLYTHDSPSPAN